MGAARDGGSTKLAGYTSGKHMIVTAWFFRRDSPGSATLWALFPA